MASPALGRWKFLRRAILSAKRRTSIPTDESEIHTVSIRRFSSFDLFQVVTCSSTSSCLQFSTSDSAQPPPIAGLSGLWQLYSYANSDVLPTAIEAWVRVLEPTVSLEAMMGFDNTGNVCVWPAEEVLAYYCLEHRESFKGSKVCELGCGMTGLAGLMLACTHAPSHVLLTDGNEKSVKNVKEIVNANKERFGATSVSHDILLWDSSSLKEDWLGKFDYVICADCLFFEHLHHELALVIYKLLKPNGGIALIFAPRRGNTLEQFCSDAETYFHVEQNLHYDEKVWRVHQEKPQNYNADLHYPLKIVMKTK